METRATVLRTWGQNRLYLVIKCLQTSLVVLLQSLLCVKKGWESESELLSRGTWHTGCLEKELLLPPAGLFMQNGKLNQASRALIQCLPCHSSVKHSFVIPYGSTPGPASLIWLLSPLAPFQHTTCSQIPLGAPVAILICPASSLTLCLLSDLHLFNSCLSFLGTNCRRLVWDV